MNHWLEISKQNLLHNFKALSNVLDKHNIAWVLKSNAYGHGLKEVYQILSERNPSFLGVNDVYEAASLRKLGYQKRLLILGPVLQKDFREALTQSAEITVGSPELLADWLQAKNQPHIHLKIDTGLTRQGFYPKQLSTLTTKKLYSQKEKILGVMTHFANVEDVVQQDYAASQLALFKQAHNHLKKEGYSLAAHAAASAASLVLKPSRLGLCRIGISLYGYWPSALTKSSYSRQKNIPLRLAPVLTWKARLTSVRSVPKGTYVSYGCSYQTRQDLTIGILSVGYHEGYPRIASNKGAYALHQETKCPILGKICMNMMIIDITNVPKAKAGDIVVLIGKQGTKEITTEQLSTWAESIPREITARLNPYIKKKIT